MGLVLFPGDGDNSSPDVSWSYSGFAAFRRCLAETEGFVLSEMRGFGGECPWSEVSTALELLLDHSDAGGKDLSPDECASILVRLEAITDQWARKGGDQLLRQHIEDGVLAVVLENGNQGGGGGDGQGRVSNGDTVRPISMTGAASMSRYAWGREMRQRWAT